MVQILVAFFLGFLVLMALINIIGIVSYVLLVLPSQILGWFKCKN